MCSHYATISRTIFFLRAETPSILAAGVGIDNIEEENKILNMHISEVFRSSLQGRSNLPNRNVAEQTNSY